MSNWGRIGVIGFACLASCVLPESRLGRAPSSLSRELERVERRDAPEEILTWVAAEISRARRPEDRALLELARARALTQQQRSHRAELAFDAAWRQIAPRRHALASEIHTSWGDARLAAADPEGAVEHYAVALDCSGVSGQARERLMASLVLAHEAAGNKGTARVWGRRLGEREVVAISNARARLQLVDKGLVRDAPGLTPRYVHPGTGASRVLPEIHRRSEWRANPSSSNVRPMGRITRLTVHHSAMPVPRPGDEARHLREIQSFHKQDRGWADVGYHVLIDPSGGVWEGREWQRQGAHAAGDNNIGNLGICLLGDFTKHGVPARQLASLHSVLDRVRGSYGIATSEVYTHREFKSTECPGPRLQSAVNAYRRSARDTRSLQSSSTSPSVRRKSS